MFMSKQFNNERSADSQNKLQKIKALKIGIVVFVLLLILVVIMIALNPTPSSEPIVNPSPAVQPTANVAIVAEPTTEALSDDGYEDQGELPTTIEPSNEYEGVPGEYELVDVS